MNQNGEPAVKPDNKLTSKQIAFAIGVPIVVVGAGLVALIASGGGDGNPEGSSIVACEHAVKARLKAPSTAHFQSGAVVAKPGLWRVVGSVDAQNSFGAQIRTDFSCNVAWDTSTKSAVVGSVEIQP